MKHLAAASLLALMLAEPTRAAERFPDLTPEAMTPEQKTVADAIASGPRKSIAGPFKVWLRSPALADRLQKVGAYLRFDTSLPKRLNEFVILVAGQYWHSQFEWDYHYPLALKEGVPAPVLADLAAGRRPAGMSGDEALVYDVSTELRRTRTVSDATFAKALARLGERGLTDLIAVNGYYDLVCMTLNVGAVPVPEGSKAPKLAPSKLAPSVEP